MHTVMWTFKVPAGTSKAQLIETFNATAHTYEGIPGLIRKYYGIAPDGGSLVGIYLWESVTAANAFYTSDWVAMVTKRWAGPSLAILPLMSLKLAMLAKPVRSILSVATLKL